MAYSKYLYCLNFRKLNSDLFHLIMFNFVTQSDFNGQMLKLTGELGKNKGTFFILLE
jgi:hypothetical protein